MAQNIAIERVDHIGVRVRNLDRAVGSYRVLGFTVVRRAEGDDVAIIRNEHGVELNLVFNANAGDSAANILPRNDRRAEEKRHSDRPGTSQFWRERADFGVRARP